jgi:heat shock protein HslJ
VRAAVRIIVAVLVSLAGLACDASSSQPAVPLYGVEWRALSISGRPPVAGHDVTLRLEPSGRVQGSTGCNSYGGSFELRDGRLELRDLLMTAAACVDRGAADAERRFLEVLHAEELQVQLGGGQLRLVAAAGDVVFGATP